MSRANIPNLEILDPLSGRDPLWEIFFLETVINRI